MKQTSRYGLAFWIFAVIQCCCPDSAMAHGTGYRFLRDATTVTVEFFYSDGEPMCYAEVLVFGPQDQEVEYQNGRTDRQGRFAFYPEIPGAWRIETNDGMGHKAVGTVEVQDGTLGEAKLKNIRTADTRQPAMPSVFIKTIAGLSLILNLVLVFSMCKRGALSRKGKG